MQKSVLQLLRDLIAIPSVFPAEERIARYCADFLKKAGFNVKLVPIGKKRYNLVATKGSQKRCILLFGHLDTVPAYNYTKNPYKMLQKGDVIKGLGSWDMKSGLAIIMSAASKADFKKIGVKIVFSSDEENNSLGSHITYKRDFFKNVLIGITPEIVDSHEKGNCVLLGRRGRVVYKIGITGIAGHGASLKGVSAISVASRLVEFIEGLKFKGNNFLGPTTAFVRTIEGNSTSLSLPEKCTVCVDVHYVPPYTEESLLKEIKKRISSGFSYHISKGAGINAEIMKRDTPYLKPYMSDRRNPYVKGIIDLLKKKMKGMKISAGMTVADENIVGMFVPVITLGPIGGEAHSSREWVSKKSVIELERAYLEIIHSISSVK